MVRKTKARINREVRQEVRNRMEEEVEDIEFGEEIPVQQRIPGKVVRGSKTAWTAKDIEKIFPICEFTPEETIPVTYNSVRYQLIAGVSMIAPTIIRDIYLEHRRRASAAGRHLPEHSGFETIINLGAGPLPPE